MTKYEIIKSICDKLGYHYGEGHLEAISKTYIDFKNFKKDLQAAKEMGGLTNIEYTQLTATKWGYGLY